MVTICFVTECIDSLHVHNKKYAFHIGNACTLVGELILKMQTCIGISKVKT